ncbi:MAG: CDGSH iron-sulfur domain-containing protein [Nanoarchaeota archaeon]
MKKEAQKIKVSENGPYLVFGNLPLSKQIITIDKDNQPEKWKEEKKYKTIKSYALCRCGKSKNKPFCDSSHVAAKFNGTESANPDEKFKENAQLTKGPELILQDNEQFCSGAGFCHRKGGTWNLTEQSNNKESKDEAIRQACNCPSGRLVALNKKTRKPVETIFKPSIVLTEHPNHFVSGPLWVRGNITIESCEGKQYEKRNRVTLCRCGKSSNKPFCDGTHIDIEFKD